VADPVDAVCHNHESFGTRAPSTTWLSLPRQARSSLRITVLADASQWLRSQRELAFYGDVEWIPTERYGPLEGERALAAAREALALAEELIAGG